MKKILITVFAMLLSSIVFSQTTTTKTNTESKTDSDSTKTVTTTRTTPMVKRKVINISASKLNQSETIPENKIPANSATKEEENSTPK